MEVTEGNVRVGTEPTVTIGDTSIETADRALIKREMLSLVKTIGTMREELIALRRENKKLKGEIL